MGPEEGITSGNWFHPVAGPMIIPSNKDLCSTNDMFSTTVKHLGPRLNSGLIVERLQRRRWRVLCTDLWTSYCRGLHPDTERMANDNLFGPPVAPRSEELLKLWSEPGAAAYLLQTADHLQSLPAEDERLQQLLTRTQKILSAQLAKAIRRQGSQRTPPAILKEAAVLLTRLLHMLQRNPSQGINSAPDMDPLQSVWFCVLCTLERITGSLHFQAKRADQDSRCARALREDPDFLQGLRANSFLLGAL